jgi:hypothetical protein
VHNRSIKKMMKIAKGELCSHCGCQPPRPGLKTCVRCSNQSKAHHKKHRIKIAKREKLYWSKNQEKYKEKCLRNNLKRYGLTINQFNNLNESQKGLCAICFRPSQNGRLHVDHDHQTGEVRGLLCWTCNVAIGAMAENIDRLYAVIAYLKSHKMEMAGGQKTAQS